MSLKIQNAGSLAWSIKSAQLRAQRESDYNAFPKYCYCCQLAIPFTQKANKFCSHNCSATFNNASRAPRTSESKLKTSRSVSLVNKELYLAYSKIQFCACEVCQSRYVYGSPTSYSARFCSKSCRLKSASAKMSLRLANPLYRKNYGRGKKSYMEQSFETWLKSYSIEFETEVHFRNYTLNKSYFADFVFRDLKLIIELDGSQHLKTAGNDKIRDDYIKDKYGFTVLRISHYEYQQKSKLPLVCDLLNI